MSRYFSPVLYVLLILVGCSAFISIAGVRVGIFQPLTGFKTLTFSVFASLVLCLLAILSLRVCRRERNSSSKRFFGLVLVISLVYSTMWIAFYLQKSNLPNINDITTDTVTPPAYLNINFIRDSTSNDLTYNSKFAEIQHKYYPMVKPLFSMRSHRLVYSQVVSLVESRGWEMIAQYPEVGVIEATARTPIFGFRDDIVIRINKREGRMRVDMRSCSRVGKGDFGANAKRIESFMKDLSVALNSLKSSN